MRSFFYALLFLLLGFAALPALAQAPTVTVPANGATGVAVAGFTITVNSTSTGNDPVNYETIDVEISSNSGFSGGTYWGSDDIVRDNDTPSDYFTAGPTAGILSPGTTYYIRAYSDVNGIGPTNTFTTAAAAVTGTNRVSLVNGQATNTTTATVTCKPNARYMTFDLNSPIGNATEYVIQFDTTSSAFTHVIDSVVFTGTTKQLKVDLGGIRGVKLSGQTVYVRSHGRNSGSYGPFVSTGYRRYLQPLQPCSLASPTGIINRYQFKLWTLAVTNASKYYFQVSTRSDFASSGIYSNTGAWGVAFNRTVAGVGQPGTAAPTAGGNVFENNYTAGGNGRAFNYLRDVTNTTYYVRVCGWNSAQRGYWADTLSIAPNPTLTTGFVNPTASATGVKVDANFTFYNDPNFPEDSWDLQVSTSSGFSTFTVNKSVTIGTTYVPGLAYNTTYFARVRSHYSGATTPWTTISFTTETQPVSTVIYPTSGTVWNKLGIWAYATGESPQTYEWQVERLTNTDTVFNGTSTFVGRNFRTFLRKANSYRIRVRGVVASQGITGPWSTWVPFSTSSTATDIAPPAASAPPAAKIALARLGDDESEPMAYPNPFAGHIILTLPTGARSYMVTDLSGRIVATSAQPSALQEVGESWPRGVYLISVTMTEGQTKRLRIIKQ